MQFLAVDIREILVKDWDYFRIFQHISEHFTYIVQWMLQVPPVKNEPYDVIKHIQKVLESDARRSRNPGFQAQM